MGKLEGGRTAGGEEHLDSGDEVVNARHLGENVRAEHEVGRPSLGGKTFRQGSTEELSKGRNAAYIRRLGDVQGGLDSEYWDPAREKVLSSITRPISSSERPSP